jgi:hypothetical protein
MAETTFHRLKEDIQSIYGSWHMMSDAQQVGHNWHLPTTDSAQLTLQGIGEYVIVSRQALERWLSQDSFKSSVSGLLSGLPQPEASSETDLGSAVEGQTSIQVNDVLCIHRKLDYKKAKDMKCLPTVSPVSNLAQTQSQPEKGHHSKDIRTYQVLFRA